MYPSNPASIFLVFRHINFYCMLLSRLLFHSLLWLPDAGPNIITGNLSKYYMRDVSRVFMRQTYTSPFKILPEDFKLLFFLPFLCCRKCWGVSGSIFTHPSSDTGWSGSSDMQQGNVSCSEYALDTSLELRGQQKQVNLNKIILVYFCLLIVFFSHYINLPLVSYCRILSTVI